MDGIMAEDVVNTKDARGPWLGRCINTGITAKQVRAIFEKELDSNPESWHTPAAFVLRKRLNDFCNDRLKQ